MSLKRITDPPRRRPGLLLPALLALAGLLAPGALAPPAQAALWPAGEGDLPRGEEREGDDLRETIEIYMLAKMKRAVDLTREQEEEMIPLVRDLSSARQQYRRERQLALMRLRPMVESQETSEAEFRAELDRLQEDEIAFRDQERRTMDRVRAILSPRQQALFALFIERFSKEMHRRLREMRRMHGEEGPRGPGNGPRHRGRPPGGL